MDTWHLIEMPKPYHGKRTSSINGACLIGCLHAEECKYIHINLPAQNPIAGGSKTSPYNWTLNLIEGKLRKCFKLIGPRDKCLKTLPTAKELRPEIINGTSLI